MSLIIFSFDAKEKLLQSPPGRK